MRAGAGVSSTIYLAEMMAKGGGDGRDFIGSRLGLLMTVVDISLGVAGLEEHNRGLVIPLSVCPVLGFGAG